MTYRQVATLACKVLAIFTLVNALHSLDPIMHALGSVLYWWSVQSTNTNAGYWIANSWGQLMTLIPFLLQVVAGIWLWKRAGVVAVWITGQHLHDESEEQETDAPRVTAVQIQAVVLSSLGVWVLLDVAPSILSMAFQFIFAWIIARGRFDAGAYVVTNQIWIWAFQTLLGLWLIFGAAGITRLLRRARGETPPT